MNAHSSLWGYPNDSPRGNTMEDFISSTNLHLLNVKDAGPTFQQRNVKGWPDLTLSIGQHLSNTTSREVLEDVSFSDHNFIKIQLNIKMQSHSYTRFKTAYGGHNKFIQNFQPKVNSIQQEINFCNSKEDLDKVTSNLQTSIFQACKRSYKTKKAKKNFNINWWTQDFDIKKKELKVLQRRASKT
ncbi:hypothetical protein AVEN_74523-1 [Araneus ventricosus]|uniref:Endonuclease/exonuclease/phosphatase domain-containing protein n=1 Tax=Araneus ventricosus TaxID=182803 RepID=A0A4Y2GPN8_ARAVE|nr:hypothetical protein AVEN_74523-1 [Araneus ventricosus]